MHLNKRIAVIGSSNTDMVIKAKTLPLPGETILGGKFFMFPGGKGANQAVAASRLGGSVSLIAKVGSDVFGKQAIAQFQKEGIDVHHVYNDPINPSGVALIMVDGRGENSIAVAPGANSALSINDVEKALPALVASEVILLQLEIPVDTVIHTIKRSLENKKLVILNPAPAQILPEALFKDLYLITPNETEAEILTGIKVENEKSAKEASDKLRQMGVINVVLTLGAKGAYINSEQVSKLVSAPVVQAVDTTAAGDVFNGALAVGISAGQSLEQAVQFANTAAALSVTKMGAQASAPYLSELNSSSIKLQTS